MMKFRWVLPMLAALFPPVTGAQAQAWPTKPLEIVVPFAAGGGTDILARLVAPGLGSALGQQVIVVNKPGASSIIGTDLVAKSQPDGHTLLLIDSSITVNPSLRKNLPYDALKDLKAVVHAASAPVLLVTHPSVPAKSAKELVDLARKQPDKLSYASGGNGASTHLAGELFKLAAGVRILHVPYKGVGAAFVDVVGGQVSMIFAGIGTAGGFVTEGKLHPVALTGSQRNPAMPNVPTFAEVGLPSVDSSTLWGFLVAAGTPLPIVERLNTELTKVLKNPAVQARLIELGYTVGGGSPDAYAQLLRSETAKWQRVIEQAGIRIE